MDPQTLGLVALAAIVLVGIYAVVTLQKPRVVAAPVNHFRPEPAPPFQPPPQPVYRPPLIEEMIYDYGERREVDRKMGVYKGGLDVIAGIVTASPGVAPPAPVQPPPPAPNP